MYSPSARRVWLFAVGLLTGPRRRRFLTGHGRLATIVNQRPASAIRQGQFALFLGLGGVVGEWTVSNPHVTSIRRKLGRFWRLLRPLRRGG